MARISSLLISKLVSDLSPTTVHRHRFLMQWALPIAVSIISTKLLPSIPTVPMVRRALPPYPGWKRRNRAIDGPWPHGRLLQLLWAQGKRSSLRLWWRKEDVEQMENVFSKCHRQEPDSPWELDKSYPPMEIHVSELVGWINEWAEELIEDDDEK